MMFNFTINFALDINECREGLHQCQHICQNTIGSYICDCNDGFMLGNDGTSCNGKKLLSTLLLHYDHTDLNAQISMNALMD